jgi:hypothetical protein
VPKQGDVVWSAPSTDGPRRKLGILTLLAAFVLVAGTDGATARSWSSLNELAARSGFARNDITAPSRPSRLTLTRVTAAALSLSWRPSRDNRRLNGYVLYRDGAFVVATSRTSTRFKGLACGRTYRLAVAAFDAAGNRSESATLSASTSPCPDTLAPTRPTNVIQTGATETTISLFWSPSLDDVGVAGYGLYRDGVRIGTAIGTRFVVESLACGKSFLLGIDSYDSAGNRSAATSFLASTSACPVTATAPTPPPPSSQLAQTPQLGETPQLKTLFAAQTLDCHSWGCEKDYVDVTRYASVIVQPSHHDLLARANAAGTLLHVYKCMASARDPARWGQTAGIPWSVAQAHPEWFLLDQNGNRIQWAPWPGTWQMDVGNPAYQQAWLEAVLAETKLRGWKAIAIDNANIDPKAAGYFNVTMAKYPTREAYMEATRSFLAYVGPRLKAEGITVVPNIQVHGDASLLMQVYRDWLPHVSGTSREHWLRWPGDSASIWGGQDWLNAVGLFEEAQRQGKRFGTGTQSGGALGPQAVRYGYASFLIAWKGQTHATFGAATAPQADKTWMVEIGLPLEERRLYATNVWGKRYTGGIALANIGTTSQTFSLGGTYRQPDGQLVSSVTLAARHGLVLRSG